MILRLYFVIASVFFCACLPAQEKALMIEGTAPNIYLIHSVAPKENIYSIGRLYNISPKEQIAPFNNMQMDKPLSIGQTIKIPLNTNFSQDGNAAPDEALIPVYHIVAEKEGLFRVSTNYNKVPMETLRQWNNIKTENVSKGAKLIVGYLKVKKELSAFASMGAKIPVITELPKEPVKAPVVKTEVKKETVPPVITKTEKPVVTEPVKKDPPIAKVTEPTPPSEGRPDMTKFKGGAFKTDFNDQKGSDASTENGAGNVFKSTSGWHDGKYYCLHNSAAPGTIIKITSNTTGKTIYAKVLDIMPDIKQNNGILIRVSNAAAEELGVGENKFDCTLSYTK